MGMAWSFWAEMVLGPGGKQVVTIHVHKYLLKPWEQSSNSGKSTCVKGRLVLISAHLSSSWKIGSVLCTWRRRLLVCVSDQKAPLVSPVPKPRQAEQGLGLDYTGFRLGLHRLCEHVNPVWDDSGAQG